MVTKKPTASRTISPRSIDSGHPKRWATMSTPCSSANAAAAYANTHCTSLRSLRRPKNPSTRQPPDNTHRVYPRPAATDSDGRWQDLHEAALFWVAPTRAVESDEKLVANA